MIDYKLRLHGLPIRWRSKISNGEPPFQFVDQQEQGPYRYWHHLHTFEEVAGGTLVCDVANYAVALGFITHPLLVKRDLTKVFEFRRETMCRIFTPINASGQSESAVSKIQLTPPACGWTRYLEFTGPGRS